MLKVIRDRLSAGEGGGTQSLLRGMVVIYGRGENKCFLYGSKGPLWYNVRNVKIYILTKLLTHSLKAFAVYIL